MGLKAQHIPILVDAVADLLVDLLTTQLEMTDKDEVTVKDIEGSRKELKALLKTQGNLQQIREKLGVA